MSLQRRIFWKEGKINWLEIGHILYPPSLLQAGTQNFFSSSDKRFTLMIWHTDQKNDRFNSCFCAAQTVTHMNWQGCFQQVIEGTWAHPTVAEKDPPIIASFPLFPCHCILPALCSALSLCWESVHCVRRYEHTHWILTHLSAAGWRDKLWESMDRLGTLAS